MTSVGLWFERLPLAARVSVGAIVAVLLLAIASTLWLSWSMYSGLTSAKAAAVEAREAARSGDSQRMQGAVAQLQGAVDQVNTAVWSPPVRIASYVPYVGRSVRDAQYFSDAGVSAVGIAEQLAPAYQADVFANQTINLQTVDGLLAALPGASQELTSARESLELVKGDGIAGGLISGYRDDALAGIATLDVATDQFSPNRANVLRALGSESAQYYLVPLLNNVQLRASGGAALSVSVIKVDQGKVTVPFSGYVEGKAYKGHPRIQYDSTSKVACQSSAEACASVPLWGKPEIGLSFTSANNHPDWRMSGEDLRRVWNASQDLKVDGVIALDTRALQSLLRVTGPVETEEFGTVDSTNFTDLVLQGSYDEYSEDQEERQRGNDEIGDAVIRRLLSGNAATLVTTASVLVQEAQGRHVQAVFTDPVLEEAVVNLGMGGVVRADQGGDSIGIYSRNRNRSKVDIYSQRDLAVKVDVAADGSATVSQTLSVHNGATDHGNDSDTIGYLTNLSVNDWLFVLPVGATDSRLTTPAGYDKASVHPDGFGREVLATTGELPVGETAELVARYSLPSGTFSTTDGLEYRTYLNPQPLHFPVNLSIDVRLPSSGCSASPEWNLDAGEATFVGPLERTEVLSIRCPGV